MMVATIAPQAYRKHANTPAESLWSQVLHIYK